MINEMCMKCNIIKNMNRNNLSVILRLSLTLLLIIPFGALLAAPASVWLHGVVRDAHTLKPVMAAQIAVINGDASATTDENGKFKILLNNKLSILKVKAFDYAVREVPVRGVDSLSITLYPDVFNTYYKSVENINGTASNAFNVNSVVATGNVSQTVVSMPDQLLQLEAGGDVRTVGRSAQIAQGASMFIRGLNSINANAQPLIVVDGIIWNHLSEMSSIHQGLELNLLGSLDMNDIESITVVKDGTSLYGSKAANGVVLIKTKRTTELSTKISFDMVLGLTSEPKTLPVMGVSDYRIYATEMLGTAGYTNAQIDQMGYLSDNPKRSTYKLYHNNTNWADQVYNRAFSQSYNINVKGGDEKALYYFSLGYVTKDGVVNSADYQRYTLRYNGDVSMAKNVKLAVNMGFSRTDRKVVDDGVNAYTSPTWLAYIKSPFLSPNTFTFTGERTTEYANTDIFNIGNPAGVLAYANNTNKQNRFNITLKPTFQINKHLSFVDNFDYSLDKLNEDYYRPMSYTTPLYIDGIGATLNSRSSQVIRNNAIFNDARFNWKFSCFGNQIELFAGSRYQLNSFESDFVEAYNSGSNTSINLPGSFSKPVTAGVNNVTKSISNYVNLALNYQNRYFLNLVTSMDASSRFGSQTKSGLTAFGRDWAIFPAVNAAWNISSEKFMRHLPAVSLFKVRAGLGMTGNDDIRDYQLQTYFSSVRFKSVANGLVISNLANPSLQWETTARANMGFDLGLFNDRLMLTVDAYASETSNLLVQKQYQDYVGLDSYWTNDGRLGNKGIEVSLNAKILNLDKFHWEMGVSAGHYKNKILELKNGSIYNSVCDGEVVTQVGGPVAQFYGYKALGVFSTEAEAATASKTTGYLTTVGSDGLIHKFGAGDIHFQDLNNDGKIDKNDRQVIGNPNPDIYGTFSNKLSYRNITFTALFTYSYGNDVYNYLRSQLEAGKDFGNQSTMMRNRWTSENQITNTPKVVYGDPVINSRFSDRWIEDGSYIRLKSLSISYTLPVKAHLLESVNIWASANNVFILTNYLGSDPEVSSHNSSLYQGVDAGYLPSSRSYNIGVKFNL